jgi:hypothetical protein
MEKSRGRTEGGQVIHHILWNSNSHYLVHENLPFVCTLSQWIQLTTLLLILYSHLRLGLRSGMFPSGYPIKILELLTDIQLLKFIVVYIQM